MLAAINTQPGSREYLEHKHGQVWDTQQLSDDFEVMGFMAPLVVVRRKFDNQKGSLMFQASPRFYFGFEAHRPLHQRQGQEGTPARFRTMDSPRNLWHPKTTSEPQRTPKTLRMACHKTERRNQTRHGSIGGIGAAGTPADDTDELGGDDEDGSFAELIFKQFQNALYEIVSRGWVR